MKKRVFLLIIGCQCAWATPHSEALYKEAERILNDFKESVYDHRNVVNEEARVYRFDCSGFVTYVLKRIEQKEALSDIPIDHGHRKARAQNFYDYFSNVKPDNPRWESIKSVQNLERGDIIAWKYDPTLGKLDTGHVVIVAQKPELETQGIYRIRVMDSTKGKHDNDSRMKGNDGLGMGDIRLRVDAQGIPVGIFWSTVDKKESHHILSMGRVK